MKKLSLAQHRFLAELDCFPGRWVPVERCGQFQTAMSLDDMRIIDLKCPSEADGWMVRRVKERPEPIKRDGDKGNKALLKRSLREVWTVRHSGGSVFRTACAGDIAEACRITHAVLGRSWQDEAAHAKCRKVIDALNVYGGTDYSVDRPEEFGGRDPEAESDDQ